MGRWLAIGLADFSETLTVVLLISLFDSCHDQLQQNFRAVVSERLALNDSQQPGIVRRGLWKFDQLLEKRRRTPAF
jgi:hypothetical protein